MTISGVRSWVALRALLSPAYRLDLGSRVFRAGRVLRIEDLGVCCWVGYGGILLFGTGMGWRDGGAAVRPRGGSDGLNALVFG